MKTKLFIYLVCLISLVYSIDYQMIDLLQDNYSSYILQLEKDVSQILDGYANKDIYSIQDIVNTTVYLDSNQMKKLDTWVVVRTFKFYNITHMYHFQYRIDENNTLKLINDGKDQFNILEGWLQEADAIKFYNLIDILKGFLCKSHKKCGDFDLTKKITKNPNQGCWKTDIKMALYGEVKTSLMGCYLSEKDTNLTYHLSVYSDMNSQLSINKTVSYYYMDYSTLEQEVYFSTSDSLDNFSLSNEKTIYVDKKIQQLLDNNLLNKPPGYKPFKPDGPNTDGAGLGGFTIFLIVLACSIFIGAIGYFGFKFCKKRNDLQSDNSFNKL